MGIILKPKAMNPTQISVINANSGDVRDVLFVANGNLYCPGDVANNATNKGLESEIPWNTIKTITIQPYQAGVYQAVILNFNADLLHDFTPGTKYSMVITAKDYKRTFTVFCPTLTEGDQLTRFEGNAFVDGTLNDTSNTNLHMATAFFNLLRVEPELVVTQATTKLTITGNFGTDQVGNTPFTVTMNWLTAGTAMHITLVEDDVVGSKITTTEDHGFNVGDFVYPYGVTWTAEPTVGDFTTNPYQVIGSATAKTFTINHVFDGATYGSGGHVVETAQRTSVLSAIPYGTEEIVEIAAPGYSVGSATYTTVTIAYEVPMAFNVKEFTSVIYIETTLTEVIALITSIKAGTLLAPIIVEGVSKANPAVVTTTNVHGLVSGDYVQFVNAVVNGTYLNGAVYQATVTGTAEFTIPVDSSGWTDPETSAIAYLYQPETYYNGR